MSRLCFCASACILVCASLTLPTPTAAQTSLGDIARQTRKAPAPKQKGVITNDDLQNPRRTPPEKNDLRAETYSTTTAPVGSDPEGTEAKQKKTESVQSRSELLASWRARIGAKKHEVELLERECTVAEREAHLQERDYYMDAGERLRNPRTFAEKQEKTKAEIETKRASLEAAKQQLTDMVERARKEGIPASQVE